MKSIAVRDALLAMTLMSFAPSIAKWLFVREGLTSKEVLTVSTFVVCVFFFLESFIRGQNPISLFNLSTGALFSYALGLVFAGALFFYYKALAEGAVTVVVPIWGLQIVVASVIALVVFNEGMNINKALGIFFAILSVFFVSR